MKKKDGTTRFCVDFRHLNERTVGDSFPIPRIEDSLDALGGANIFTTLDLAKGYWQVPVQESDKSKTAFSMPQRFVRIQYDAIWTERSASDVSTPYDISAW